MHKQAIPVTRHEFHLHQAVVDHFSELITYCPIWCTGCGDITLRCWTNTFKMFLDMNPDHPKTLNNFCLLSNIHTNLFTWDTETSKDIVYDSLRRSTRNGIKWRHTIKIDGGIILLPSAPTVTGGTMTNKQDHPDGHPDCSTVNTSQTEVRFHTATTITTTTTTTSF